MSDGRPFAYRHDGTPIEDMHEFERLLSDPNYKIIRHTNYVKAGILVSSVWIGTDMYFGNFRSPNYRPLIFETMVLGRKPGRKERWFQERHTSIEQALEAHQRAVLWLPKRIREREEPEVFSGVLPLSSGWL